MPRLSRIMPCLWFDRQAEEAAEHYTSIFPGSRIVAVSRYGEAGREVHGMEAGTVLTIVFELDGQAFTAMNGGPVFQFNEAISLQVPCDTQEEIDHYWDRLGAGGDARAQQCGWLKDRYGVSWQVVPSAMGELLDDSDPARAARVMNAMLQMRKIELAALHRAYDG